MRDKIKKDLVKCYTTEDEMCTIAEAVVFRNNSTYKHLLDCYCITVEELEEIFIEMGYIGS